MLGESVMLQIAACGDVPDYGSRFFYTFLAVIHN